MKQVYSVTVGSNIGKTGAVLLAALIVQGNKVNIALEATLCHLLFNITGFLLFYVIPLTRIPPLIAERLGTIVTTHYWFPRIYLILSLVVSTFVGVILPLAGTIVYYIFVSIITIILTFNIVVNAIQFCKPHLLLKPFGTCSWLPLWMRSLDPYDPYMSRLCVECCKRNKSEDRIPLQAPKNTRASDLDRTDGSYLIAETSV